MGDILKNGYYLSIYSAVSDIGHIYSIPIRHNHNMALWLKKGNLIKLIHYWELERISALKEHYIEAVLCPAPRGLIRLALPVTEKKTG